MAEHTASSTIIAAGAQAVFEVIADVEAYPEWAEQMKSATVLSRDRAGRAAEVEFVLNAGVVKDTYTLGYSWDVRPDGTGTVSWRLLRAELLKTLDGAYTLEAVPAGTRVGYRLTVDTTMPMIAVLKRRAEKVIVDTALFELDTRVRALTAAG
ncbi:SRPBCC family protein [Dermacoccaceae bacterium W4C1]